MNWKSGPFLKSIFFGLFVSFAAAGPLDDKTPGYFVDRYGPAKSSRTESQYSFSQAKIGSVTIKGPFSVREFRKNDLKVQAIFFHPSLRLAAVRLQLNRQWTQEQIEAALAAYGGEWKLRDQKMTSTGWQAPDGTVAISKLTWLDFQSKEVRDAVEKGYAEFEAKQKAVPRF